VPGKFKFWISKLVGSPYDPPDEVDLDLSFASLKLYRPTSPAMVASLLGVCSAITDRVLKAIPDTGGPIVDTLDLTPTKLSEGEKTGVLLFASQLCCKSGTIDKSDITRVAREMRQFANQDDARLLYDVLLVFSGLVPHMAKTFGESAA
jgi:hypothetical protein